MRQGSRLRYLEAENDGRRGSRLRTSVTKTSALMGSPLYMSPSKCARSRTQRADRRLGAGRHPLSSYHGRAPFSVNLPQSPSTSPRSSPPPIAAFDRTLRRDGNLQVSREAARKAIRPRCRPGRRAALPSVAERMALTPPNIAARLPASTASRPTATPTPTQGGEGFLKINSIPARCGDANWSESDHGEATGHQRLCGRTKAVDR